MNMVQDVEDFHRKFDIPTRSKPGLLDDATFNYRYKFLVEELREFEEAHIRGDIVGSVDGLLDLIYVALGTLLKMGLGTEQIEGCWQAIQNCNMDKERVPSAAESKRGHSSDVRKPLGWVGPEKKMAVLLGLNDV